MTPEQQRIAIAEACGWRDLYFINDLLVGLPPFLQQPRETTHRDVPDYLNDLNAMHEAEKVLAYQCKEHDYWFYIRQVIGFSDAQCDWDEVCHFKAVHATAAQRAEAFLRTLNLWTP